MLKKLLSVGPLFIVIAAVMWSLDGLLRGNLVEVYKLPPIIIVFWEHLIGLLLIVPWFWLKRGDLKKLTRKEWIAIALVALFSSTLGNLFYTQSLTRVFGFPFVPFSVVVLLQQTQPIWGILAAALLLKERITLKFLSLAILAILGAYLISFKDLSAVAFSLDNAYFVTGGLALLAAMSWGTGTAFSKYVLNKVSFVTAVGLRFGLAVIFSVIIAGFLGQFNQFALSSFGQFQNLIYIVLLTGVTAMLIYYYGLGKTPSRVSSIAELAWPASALVIDIVMGKSFSSTQILGIVILIISMFIVARTQKDENSVISVLEG